jgi:hypothetical protein
VGRIVRLGVKGLNEIFGLPRLTLNIKFSWTYIWQVPWFGRLGIEF